MHTPISVTGGTEGWMKQFGTESQRRRMWAERGRPWADTAEGQRSGDLHQAEEAEGRCRGGLGKARFRNRQNNVGGESGSIREQNGKLGCEWGPLEGEE